MRLVLLICLTMMAFAGNSVLTRAGLVGEGMDAVSFGTIRLVAGALTLLGLCLLLRGGLRLWGPGRAFSVAALLLYFYAFSAASDGLDAGLGAIILFGVVQITMFAGGLVKGETMPARRWLGAALSMAGLVWLLWPDGAVTVSLWHGLSMALGGVGWGLYSLAGRASRDALNATAANFLLTAPLGVLLWLGFSQSGALPPVWDSTGAWLAVLSGAVTSGMGYALWYSVLPRIEASVAAVAQLSVPVIAMAGGMVLLGEVLTLRFVLAGGLVLGGVALSVMAPKRSGGGPLDKRKQGG